MKQDEISFATNSILFHDYTCDENGILPEENCLIPKNRNHNNIWKDIDKLVQSLLDKSGGDIRFSPRNEGTIQNK